MGHLNKEMSLFYIPSIIISHLVDLIASNYIIAICPKTLHSAEPVWFSKIPVNWYLKFGT